MKKKLQFNPEELSENYINPSVIAEIESKLAMINKYEKELIRPVFLSTSAVFFALIVYSLSDLSPDNPQTKTDLCSMINDFGYQDSSKTLLTFFGFFYTFSLGASFYLTHNILSSAITRFSSWVEWFGRKVLGPRPVINLENVIQNSKDIIEELNGQVKLAKELIKIKTSFYEKFLFPAFIIKKLLRMEEDIFFAFEQVFLLVVLPDVIINQYKLLTWDFGKTFVKLQLNELTKPYTPTEWEELDAGFFVLKFPRDKRKKDTYKKSYQLKSSQFLEILKTILIVQNQVVVVAHQSTCLAIMMTKTFPKAVAKQIEIDLAARIKNKLLETKTLLLLTNINAWSDVDQEWNVHYCKSKNHLSRFEFCLTSLTTNKRQNLVAQLHSFFGSENITLQDDILRVKTLDRDLDLNWTRLHNKYLKNQPQSVLPSLIMVNPSEPSRALEICNELDAPGYESNYRPKNENKRCKKEQESVKPPKKSITTSITEIEWRDHRYRSDKTADIVEMTGSYLKKGSYFGKFDASLRSVLTKTQFLHYRSIAMNGRVVPRRKAQGIVTCCEYVKASDNSWRLSIFKIKDPSKNIRIHGIEKEEPVVVDKIKRHLIEYSVMKVK